MHERVLFLILFVHETLQFDHSVHLVQTPIKYEEFK